MLHYLRERPRTSEVKQASLNSASKGPSVNQLVHSLDKKCIRFYCSLAEGNFIFCKEFP